MLETTPPAGPAPTAPTEAAAVGRTIAVEGSVFVVVLVVEDWSAVWEEVVEEGGGEDVPSEEAAAAVEVSKVVCWV